MSRVAPESRFEDLIDAATKVFIENGYQRTQMADVAEAMGVAKGTVYLYVESKEALFDLACRLADAPRPLARPSLFPVRTPARGATLEYIAERLERSPVVPLMRSLVEKKKRGEASSELELFVRELYDDLARNRRGLKLVDRSARDLPELAAIWFDNTRAGLVGLLTIYLEDRIAAGKLRRVPDAAAAARVVIETTVFWAVHRHWDAHPQQVDEAKAKQTVVHFTVGALTKGSDR
jgi:AcrR family transcriptional regulator